MHTDWNRVVESVCFAFQPIVNIHTGSCYGYEALLRGHDVAGFSSIHELFDAGFAEKELHHVDLALREKALDDFVRIEHHVATKLFYNLDSRVLNMPDYFPGHTRGLMSAHGLEPERLCFEISERHDTSSSAHMRRVLERYRSQLFRIAIDDYGSGFSGLQLLYNSEPDYIKVDRFFIEGIAADPRKRLFVSTVISMAHLLGIMVIGEGIETESELRVCREIGCDLAQGYFVQRPTTVLTELRSEYLHVEELARSDRRRRAARSSLLDRNIQRPQPVSPTAEIGEVLSALRAGRDTTFVVVVDAMEEPLGIVCESSVKRYLYSQYGWALLVGRHRRVSEYITRCPVADVHAPAERVMEMFSLAEGSAEGVILTDNGRYAGFLSAAELLKAVNERNLSLARDQNPLTRLPGNGMISEFMGEALADVERGYIFAYFDFDNFKPFNDVYGFRLGDRAIQMFADLLRMAVNLSAVFVGHVGGDDFFAGAAVGLDGHDAVLGLLREVAAKFALDVQSLYTAEDRARGGIVARDRELRNRPYPCLTVSLAVLVIPPGPRSLAPASLGAHLARLKRKAKCSEDNFAFKIHEAEKPQKVDASLRAEEGWLPTGLIA